MMQQMPLAQKPPPQSASEPQVGVRQRPKAPTSPAAQSAIVEQTGLQNEMEFGPMRDGRPKPGQHGTSKKDALGDL